jgi:hypothetical protein
MIAASAPCSGSADMIRITINVRVRNIMLSSMLISAMQSKSMCYKTQVHEHSEAESDFRVARSFVSLAFRRT